jgi:hypothetical protein
MRAQLIEFIADMRSRSRVPGSAKSALTRSWQSSKLPSIATLWTLGASTVVICRRWTSDTRPAGCSTTTSSDGRPTQAAMAAEPVSPEVATTIVARSDRRASSASNILPTSCSATSLNASVGPWNSSSTWSPGSTSTSGSTSGASKVA